MAEKMGGASRHRRREKVIRLSASSGWRAHARRGRIAGSSTAKEEGKGDTEEERMAGRKEKGKEKTEERVTEEEKLLKTVVVMS